MKKKLKKKRVKKLDGFTEEELGMINKKNDKIVPVSGNKELTRVEITNLKNKFESDRKPIKHQQRIMAKYIAAGTPINEVAEKLGVSVARCRKWLLKPQVEEYLEKCISSFVDMDNKKRKNKIEFIYSQVYEAMIDKLADGSLQALSVKSLMRMALDLNRTMREESPPQVANKNVNHNHKISAEIITQLSERYKVANSVGFIENQKEKIIDIIPPVVAPPKELKEPENDKQREEESGVDDG